jgi:hypothetical protein
MSQPERLINELGKSIDNITMNIASQTKQLAFLKSKKKQAERNYKKYIRRVR